ncbi:MAG TPA: glycosyltransferase family 1 protein [Bacteroidales bacterium]|nr:glycosyltransferase family 1 protein [Bacteroidales bacterium]
MRLRIAVNTRLLLAGRLEGIGWFTYETLRRIVVAHPEVDFYFFFDRKPDPQFLFGPNVRPVVLVPQARHPLLFIVWFEWSVRKALKKIRPHLFLSPDGYLCLGTNVPSLAVMHDLNFEHYPKDLPFLVRHYYRWFFPRFANKAARIATVSDFSRQDICRLYNQPGQKVDVVYNGVNEHFGPLTPSEVKAVRERYTGGAPYFLFVGSLHPRKNLSRLFRAFDEFKASDNKGLKLLVAGERKWWTNDIEQAYSAMTFKKDVVFCGRLNSDELHRITASAFVYTYVSYFEGFGIPIIEAFKCGVPLITSNVTSMPEVAGDAALLINPFDVHDIAQAMQRLAEDENLRNELINKGIERSKLFTWDAAALRLWQSIEKTLSTES